MIEMPYPHSDLNPNKRVHRTTVARLRKAQKKECYFLAIKQLKNKPPKKENYHLEILFYPPSNHARDLDNAYASCKAMFDGIARAWGVDDKFFRPITLDFRPKTKDGKVTIRCVN